MFRLRTTTSHKCQWDKSKSTWRVFSRIDASKKGRGRVLLCPSREQFDHGIVLPPHLCANRTLFRSSPFSASRPLRAVSSTSDFAQAVTGAIAYTHPFFSRGESWNDERKDGIRGDERASCRDARVVRQAGRSEGREGGRRSEAGRRCRCEGRRRGS